MSEETGRSQQVKVVIRLKPQSQQTKYSKCVSQTQPQSSQIAIDTDGKKQIFQFDHVANQNATQVDIFNIMGKQSASLALEGYNTCIFAYGQTGAGKTYSILGDSIQLQNNPYCESRGLLPRLLQDIFQTAKNCQNCQNVKITCCYMQIYNQQILDLFSGDRRVHHIREDVKKGVFVQGLIQRTIQSYHQSMRLLLEGQKMRRTAATLMNSQSSRSHAIFTIQIQKRQTNQQIVKIKKSKLHVVDLAGSQRVKHTQVEGQRLRQGCSINRSLHVLGNVINSLVQSAKKKKHIPFRDSKLTHYLKDSLGGNSITKLLANIHTNRQYFGDTLSTLMFAKRAKNLKLKVQQNQTLGDNFQSLRKQVRRLRQQLAQARYFRPDQNTNNSGQLIREQNSIKIQYQSDDITAQSSLLKILQQNQTHYKTLIEIYETHMQQCELNFKSSGQKTKRNSNIKDLIKYEKKNTALMSLLRCQPVFSCIFKQNLILKNKLNIDKNNIFSDKIKQQFQNQSINDKNNQQTTLQKAQINKVILYYQNLVEQISQQFSKFVEQSERNYIQMENIIKIKQKRVKDLIKSHELPPDIQQLKNQNQYLQLNILNLQNQIQKLQQNQRINQIQKSKNGSNSKLQSKNDIQDVQQPNLLQQLIKIKQSAQKQALKYDQQRAMLEQSIQKLSLQLNNIYLQNQRLKNRSKSKKSQIINFQQMNSISQIDMKNSFLEKGDLNQLQDQIKLINTSSQNDRTHLLPNSKQLLTMRMDIKKYQKQLDDVKRQLFEYIQGDKRIQNQFGIPLEDVIQQYRTMLNSRTLQQSKSVKIIHRQKQQTIQRQNDKNNPNVTRYSAQPKQKKKQLKKLN